jgi:hypothetical protein
MKLVMNYGARLCALMLSWFVLSLDAAELQSFSYEQQREILQLVKPMRQALYTTLSLLEPMIHFWHKRIYDDSQQTRRTAQKKYALLKNVWTENAAYLGALQTLQSTIQTTVDPAQKEHYFLLLAHLLNDCLRQHPFNFSCDTNIASFNNELLTHLTPLTIHSHPARIKHRIRSCMPPTHIEKYWCWYASGAAACLLTCGLLYWHRDTVSRWLRGATDHVVKPVKECLNIPFEKHPQIPNFGKPYNYFEEKETFKNTVKEYLVYKIVQEQKKQELIKEDIPQQQDSSTTSPEIQQKTSDNLPPSGVINLFKKFFGDDNQEEGSIKQPDHQSSSEEPTSYAQQLAGYFIKQLKPELDRLKTEYNIDEWIKKAEPVIALAQEYQQHYAMRVENPELLLSPEQAAQVEATANQLAESATLGEIISGDIVHAYQDPASSLVKGLFTMLIGIQVQQIKLDAARIVKECTDFSNYWHTKFVALWNIAKVVGTVFLTYKFCSWFKAWYDAYKNKKCTAAKPIRKAVRMLDTILTPYYGNKSPLSFADQGAFLYTIKKLRDLVIRHVHQGKHLFLEDIAQLARSDYSAEQKKSIILRMQATHAVLSPAY